MKKLLALSLAAVLALSLSVTAFADVQSQTYEYKGSGSNGYADISSKAVAGVWEIGYTEDDGVVELQYPLSSQEGKVIPGKSVYYPLVVKGSGNFNYPAVTYYSTSTVNYSDIKFVTHSDAVKSISVRATWDMGKDAIESVKVVQKKYTIPGVSGSNYGYFLCVTMRSSTSTAMRDFAGDIVLRKTSGTDSAGGQSNNLAFEIKAEVKATAGYLYMSERDAYTIYSEYVIYEADGDTGEQTFDFYEVSDTWFDVDVTGQSKVLVKADNKYNSTVANKYPQANLDFFNGSGTFNKIGTLRLHADSGSYLYVLNSDGTLSASNAEYDSYEDVFIIKTRTLGNYVISDRQLDVTPPATETPEPEPSSAPSPVEPSSSSSTPPTTGGVTGGNKPNPGTGVAA